MHSEATVPHREGSSRLIEWRSPVLLARSSRGGGAVLNAVSALNNSMSADSMAEIDSSAKALVASAKSGGFTVTKEGADPIIEVLEEYIDEIDTLKGDMRVFDQTPSLGDHSYGTKVAQHMWEAANDDRSARAALE